MIIVLFKADLREDANREDYQATLRHMRELVQQIPGFISVKRFVADDGESFTLARFASEEALEAWRTQPEHLEAQRKGREHFYNSGWAQVYTLLRESQFQRQETA